MKQNQTEHAAKKRKKMSREERTKQLRRRLFLILALLIAAAAAAAAVERLTPSKKHMSAEEYFGASDGTAAVVVDGLLWEERGLASDEVLALPYEPVQHELTPWIFYDQAEEKLIVTGAGGKEIYPFADGKTSGGEAFFYDAVLYIEEGFFAGEASCAARVYDAPSRICLFSKSSYPAGRTTEEAVMRYRAGIKSPIIRDLSEGETVLVLDGEEGAEKIDGWTLAATEDGFRGYIRDESLDGDGMIYEVQLPVGPGEMTRRQLAEPLNMAFHQTTDQASNRALSETVEHVTGINVLAPTWFFLADTEGGVTSLASGEYVEEAHAKGLQVFAVLNDFDGGISSAAETTAALTGDNRRSAIVEAVREGLVSSGADGLNVDLELIQKDTAPEYLQLLRELSAMCRQEGKTFSVDTYVPAFTSYLNRTEQARIADYVVIMCYDEHTSGSAEAGSVSSLGFVRSGIEAALAEVPKEQLVAALPFFTRLWETQGDTVSSRALGMRAAADAAASYGMELVWDEECGQHYGEAESAGTLYQIWLEDTVSLETKLSLLETYGLAGVAEWKLGLQTEEVWPLLAEALS